MEEIEVPLERVQEHIEHAAHESHGSGGHSGSANNWITWSALLSAFLAVAAAIAALKAGQHVNESMIDQIHASDQWSYYQAKGIKSAILETRLQLLEAIGKSRPQEVQDKIQSYADEQKETQEKAKAKEESSFEHFEAHEIFSKSVTLFQIAIAVTAIAILAKRKLFLLVSGGFGVVALYFLIQGLLFHTGH